MLEDQKSVNEKKFDSFLTKTIILSSKRYYKYETTKGFNELNIIDDEDYSEYLKEYLKYEEDVYNNNNMSIDNFKEQLENPMLYCALKSLSDIEMTVIFLLFGKELTSNEASKILKICSDSVTRIKRRAIRKMQKYLKGDK